MSAACGFPPLCHLALHSSILIKHSRIPREECVGGVLPYGQFLNFKS